MFANRAIAVDMALGQSNLGYAEMTEAWELLRRIQPLTPRDRRLLTERLQPERVNHREEAAVYRWLADKYERGEMKDVINAMRAEWGKGSARHPFACLSKWLTELMGSDWPLSYTFDDLRQCYIDIDPDDDRSAMVAQAALFFGIDVRAADPFKPPEPGNEVELAPNDARQPVTTNETSISLLQDRLAALVPPFSREMLAAADVLLTLIDAQRARASDADALAEARAQAEIALLGIDPADCPLLPDDIGVLRQVPAVAAALLAAREVEGTARNLIRRAADDPLIDLGEAAAQLKAARADCENQKKALFALVSDNTLPVAQEPELETAKTTGPSAEPSEPIASTSDLPQQTDAVVVDPAFGVVTSEIGSAPGSVPCIAHEPLRDTPLSEIISLAVVLTPGDAVSQPIEADAVGNESVDAELVDNGWDFRIHAALDAHRCALALQLARARDVAGAELDGSIPTAVLEALAPGLEVVRQFDPADRAYQHAAAIQVELPTVVRAHADIALLAAAGALRPAMIMSQAASQVLAQSGVNGLAAPMHALAQAYDALGKLGITDIAAVAPPPDSAENERRRSAAEASLRTWIQQTGMRTTNFGRASAAWRAVVAPNGAIGKVAAQLLQSPATAIAPARKLLDQLATNPETVIASIDMGISHRARQSPIEGTARNKLLLLLAEAENVIRQYVELATPPDQRGDRHAAVRGLLVKALAEAKHAAITQTSNTARGNAAKQVFSKVVSELQAHLAGQVPLRESEWPRRMMMELALLPAFPINGRAEITFSPADVEDVLALERAAVILDNGAPDEREAFEAACEAGNWSAAILLPPIVPDHQARIDSMVSVQRSRLLKRAQEVRSQLDDFQAALSENDPLPDQLERRMAAFEAKAIENLPRTIDGNTGINDFPTAWERLETIARELAEARSRSAASLERRIADREAKLGLSLLHCRQALADNDLAILADEIAHIERHGFTPSRDESPIAALNAAIRRIEVLPDTEKLPWPRIAAAARNGTVSGHFDFSTLSGDDRVRATALADAWLQIRRSFPNMARGASDMQPLQDAVATLFTALGFTGVEATRTQRDQHWLRVHVRVDPLRRRDACVVPAFGSDANGQYTILLVPEGSAPSLANNVTNMPEGSLVFVLGLLPQRLRQQLQGIARGGSKPLGIADDLTIATLTMLSMLPETATRAFFDLALAWGHAEPYSDASEQTSVEMFFGRAAEFGDLARLDGPCLVYGGRQLGKTALLKQVALRENSGDRIAIYCKIQRIGDSEPTQSVWREVEKLLSDRKLRLPDQGSIAERLRQWVLGAPGRSLIVMLDEADAFLQSEMADNFPVIDEIRTLMTNTNRRIKFVFAGLHNVQRFHLAPNSPFLHFGAPINVGPLMGSDWDEARRMAIEPMAALGFTFASRNDATYMLSLVGHYPSLMQSFGKVLVRTINQKIARREAKLPFVIDRPLIDSCFASQEFRQDVVGKFRKTLQLDARYELITYVLWSESQGNNVGERGLTASRIRVLVEEWWPAGFIDMQSSESFAALLDEMEQMGVLTKTGPEYQLRSRRIAAMLGEPAEIEQQLVEFVDRPPPRPSDPLSSHRRVQGVWSPLSLRQERLLKDRLEGNTPLVAMIGGLPATGIDDLPGALKAMCDQLEWPKLREQPVSATVDTLLQVAVGESRDARPGRPKLILVAGRWPDAAEIDRLLRDRALKDRDRPVRILFTGSPSAIAVTSLTQRPDVFVQLLGPLSTDTLRHWLTREDIQIEDDESANFAMQQMLRETTGGWLAVLDSIKLPPTAQRRDAVVMHERAQAAANGVACHDLGMMGETLADAQRLYELIGDNTERKADLDGLGDHTLSRICADLALLGIIETSGKHLDKIGFNSLARRVLAGA